MSTYCPSCGTPHAPDAHFCEECGAHLGAPPAQQAPPAGQAETQPIQPPPAGQNQPFVPPAVAPVPAVSSNAGWLSPLVIVALVLAVLAIGLVGFLLLRSFTSGSGGGTVTASSSPSPSPSPTVTRTKKPKPTPTVTVTRTAIPDLPDWPASTVPGTYKKCDLGVYASPETSCPFAVNVASAWYTSGGSNYLSGVYSPVTDRYYDMYCTETLPTECTGGTNASVVIDYIP